MNMNNQQQLKESTPRKKSWLKRVVTNFKNKFKLERNQGTSLEAYLDLPKNDRTFWIFYKKPKSYLFIRGNGNFLSSFQIFKKYWKENFPIQYFFRETIPDWVNGWVVEYKYRKDKIKRFFVSENHRHKNLIPREYADDSYLLSHVILQMFKNFEKEFNSGIVDWDAMDHTREFKEWYLKTKWKIENVIPYIEKRGEVAADKWRTLSKNDYESYDEPPETLKHIFPNKFHWGMRYMRFWDKAYDDYVTKICSEIIEKRNLFWT